MPIPRQAAPVGIRALLLKVETGESRWCEVIPSDEYQWTDGNYECDCNRHLFFLRAGNEELEDIPCSSGKYTLLQMHEIMEAPANGQ